MLEFLTGQYSKMINAIASLKSAKGQTVVEYALLLVLIAIVVIATITFVGRAACNVYSTVGSALT